MLAINYSSLARNALLSVKANYNFLIGMMTNEKATGCGSQPGCMKKSWGPQDNISNLGVYIDIFVWSIKQFNFRAGLVTMLLPRGDSSQ